MKNFFLTAFDDYVFTVCRRHRKNLFFLTAVFVAGLIAGLLLGGGGLYSDILFTDSVDFTVIIFSGKASFFSVVGRCFIVNLQYIALVVFFSLSVYLVPLHYVFICYKGYIFGAACVVFTRTLGVHGFANILILVLPQQLILLFCICLFICASMPHTLRYKSFTCVKERIKTGGVYFVFSLCNIIVQILLIYVIIKPFNILI